MKTASVNQVAAYSGKIRKVLNKVSTQLGSIQIGNTRQFPNGWGKAAKGRTVWRIVEEAINQNLKKQCTTLGLDKPNLR